MLQGARKHGVIYMSEFMEKAQKTARLQAEIAELRGQEGVVKGQISRHDAGESYKGLRKFAKDHAASGDTVLGNWLASRKKRPKKKKKEDFAERDAADQRAMQDALRRYGRD